jgi:hypothetical protein
MKVLTHPMLDQLAKLGLTGMAQAFAELDASSDPQPSPMPTGSASSSIAR